MERGSQHVTLHQSVVVKKELTQRKEGVRSSRRGFRVDSLLLHIERNLIRWLSSTRFIFIHVALSQQLQGKDASWMPPW